MLSEDTQFAIRQIKQFADRYVRLFEEKRPVNIDQMSMLEYSRMIQENAGRAGMVCEAIHTLERMEKIESDKDFNEFREFVTHVIATEIKDVSNLEFLKKVYRRFLISA